MEMKNLWMGLMLCGCVLTGQAQTQVIAHRGFWKTEGSAQNSVTALKKAAEAKVYGSEFDVQMTADNVLVVNHDDKIEGHVIAETPYEELQFLKLKNGETLPTLDDYLKAGKETDIRLILEIKPNKNKKHEKKAVKRIIRRVKNHKLQHRVEYISFSLEACEWLAKRTPKSEIAYLNGDLTPAEVKKKGIDGIDYSYRVIEKHPEWIDEAHALGMKVNVWTVNKEDLMRKLILRKVDYLTTDHPLEAKKLTEE